MSVPVQWTGEMVTPVVDLVAPMFRREVELDTGHGAVTSAVLHISSLGVHEAFLNGTPVGDDVLGPGWTSYEWRLRYRSYDVTALLGDHLLAVSVGNGWYRGRLGFPGGRAMYGKELGLIAQLEIDFADGHRQVVGTDDSWRAGGRATSSPTTSTTARRSTPAGDRAWLRRHDAVRTADPARFTPVRNLDFDPTMLQPYVGPPVIRQEILRPDADLDLAVGPDTGRLRPEPGRLAAVHRPRAARQRDPDQARRGAGGRRARRPAAARRPGHRPVHPQRRRGLLRADQDLPRLPVRRGHRLAGRARHRRPRGRRRALRAAPDRVLRVLRPGAQPAAPQRRVGREGQLPRRPDRLPAAQRAARLDRRHRRLRTLRGVPLRRRVLPRRLADRPGLGAAAPRRHGAVRRPRRAQAPARAGGVPGPRQHRHLERRGRLGAVDALPGVRRPGGAERQYDSMVAHVRRVETLVSPTGCGTRLPVRRLARPGRLAARAVERQGRQRASSPPPASTGPRRSSRETAALLGHTDDAADFRGAGGPDARGVQRALRLRRRHHPLRLHHRLHPRHRASACSTRG